MKPLFAPGLRGGFAFGLVLVLAAAPADRCAADCPLPVPDLPQCTCFAGGGSWPLPGVAGNIISTARQSNGMAVSCLRHRGQPYWQVQVQLDDPIAAHFLAHWAPNFPLAFRAQAWCGETVAFWHREAQVPRERGYATLWWPTSYMANTRQLRLWYQTEEHPGLLALFGYHGRGRWIGGSELDYDNYIPGVNGPCPGAFQAWESYDTTGGSWTDSCYHSQVVDSVVVWRRGGPLGVVERLDVHVVEGNAGGGTFVDINGTNVSKGVVKNTKWYRNVIGYTELGDSLVGCGRTVKKIRGWGIDLDADGNPLCDMGRMFTIVSTYVTDHPMPIGPDEPDGSTVNAVVAYLAAGGGAAPAVMTNASAIQTGGALPTPAAPWVIPAGPLGAEPAYIQVDLRAQHPLPVRGVIVEWEGGFAPQPYEVWWAGQDLMTHTTTMALATGVTPPSGLGPVPVATSFGPAPGVPGAAPVRYLRLVFHNAQLTRQFKITGLHVLFDFGREEDAGDVFDDTAVLGIDDGALSPGALRLAGAAPNPFGGSTRIGYLAASASVAEIAIYDVSGRRVRLLPSLPAGPQPQSVTWDGRDDRGRALKSGTYFCELRAAGQKSVRRMVLMR